jgi:inhibitor of KinA sporulation pathway (predicted exonuclease)
MTLTDPIEILRSSIEGSRYVVVDLEATCWGGKAKAKNEIIEIGAVAYKVGKGITSEFRAFVKPILQPILSDFCRNLTRIEQSQIDSAASFPEVYPEFLSWKQENHPRAVVSWGRYDYMQFASDCALHNIPFNLGTHPNLKHIFSVVQQCGRCGMKRALRELELPLEGVHHGGIDDARNIAKILEALIDQLRE